MIYQMDPSGVFVNLQNFEGGLPNFTNLPLPPTLDNTGKADESWVIAVGDFSVGDESFG